MYKSLIPNLLTSANLVLGFCSILSTYNANYTWSTVFILLALVADGLDGRAARFFGVSSEIGKEMDSLCDLVSFGVAPAFLAYTYCLKDLDYFGWAVAIAFALCGAWRLARFAAILFLGREAIVSAVLFAVFSTYSVFGLFNFSLSLLFRK